MWCEFIQIRLNRKDSWRKRDVKKVHGIGQAKEREGHLHRWESMSKSRVKKKTWRGPGPDSAPANFRASLRCIKPRVRRPHDPIIAMLLWDRVPPHLQMRKQEAPQGQVSIPFTSCTSGVYRTSRSPKTKQQVGDGAESIASCSVKSKPPRAEVSC